MRIMTVFNDSVNISSSNGIIKAAEAGGFLYDF